LLKIWKSKIFYVFLSKLKIMKVIKISLNIHVGDFIELFPQYLLDCIRDLNIYEIDINYNGRSLLYFGDEWELKKFSNSYKIWHFSYSSNFKKYSFPAFIAVKPSLFIYFLIESK